MDSDEETTYGEDYEGIPTLIMCMLLFITGKQYGMPTITVNPQNDAVLVYGTVDLQQ